MTAADDPSTETLRAGAESPLAARLRAFLANPYLNLVKAVTLLFIGISEATRTLVDDVTEKQLRVGHGLILIGAFGVLESIPHLLEAYEARKRFVEARRAAASGGGDRDANRPHDGRATS